MSQQEQTPSTTDKPVRTRRRNRHRSKGVSYSMLTAKEPNIPIGEESSDKKLHIIKWGKRNEYPYFLNYLFRKNPIHSGIIRTKVTFLMAGGLTYTGPNPSAFEEFFKNKKTSPKDKNLNELMEDIFFDSEKANFNIYKVRFSFVGERSYRKLERIPFEKVRFEEIMDAEGNLYKTGNILVSDDWLAKNPTSEQIRPYNPHNADQKVCFVMVKEESGQSLDSPDSTSINPGVYPDPPYGGAITAIDTGIQIGRFNNSEIHNNFSLGNILNLNSGAPKNDDDKKKLEREIGEAATGAYQAGRLLVLYNEGQDEAASVTTLNGNDLPDRYSNSKKGSEQSILQGHSFTSPTLAGIKTEGSLGDSKELKTAYYILKENYVQTRQDRQLQALNWIMNEIAGIEGEISFEEKDITLPDDEPQQPQFQVNMGSQGETDVILERLKVLGNPKAQYNVLHSMSMEKGELTKDQMVADFKAQFAELNDLQQQTLNLIDQDEDFDSIRKALEVSGNDLAKIYQTLEELNYINADGDITAEGKRQVVISEIESMKIMYEYALRPNAPALVPGGTSRPFCTELLRLDRLYTREDINRISGVEGYDVFAYRGGWYHNPNTGKNEPGCRHEWRQVITFE